MEVIHPLGAAYAERFSSRETPLLQEIAQFTRAQHPHAHMLSGPAQGAFLSFVSKLLQPRRILEIGTFTGYSALCLAEGLTDGGLLHTLELRKEEADIARGFFARSSYKDRILIHEGNALDILAGLPEQWDLVFIDADKTGYIAYYEAVMPYLRQGGAILADNVLFHGEVLQTPVTGKNAKAIQAFNEHVAADTRVTHALVPMRDGMMCVVKN